MIVFILIVLAALTACSLPFLLAWGKMPVRKRVMLVGAGILLSLLSGLLASTLMTATGDAALAVVEPIMMFAFYLGAFAPVDWRMQLIPRWSSVALMIAQNVFTTVMLARTHSHLLWFSLIVSAMLWALPLVLAALNMPNMFGMSDGRLLAAFTPAALLAFGYAAWIPFVAMGAAQFVYSVISALAAGGRDLRSPSARRDKSIRHASAPLAPFASAAFLASAFLVVV